MSLAVILTGYSNWQSAGRCIVKVSTVRRRGGLVDQAIGSLSEGQSSWRPAELVRELAGIVPTTVASDSQRLTDFVELLASQAASRRCVDISRPVPGGVELRRDGRPTSEPAVNRALTTKAILDQEEQLVGWAQLRLGPC